MMRTITLLALAAITEAALPTMVKAQTMRIVSATYGNMPNGRTCDATATVANVCTGRAACNVPIGNALCGDSDFLVVKSAQIKYACGGSWRLATASEYTTTMLTCD